MGLANNKTCVDECLNFDIYQLGQSVPPSNYTVVIEEFITNRLHNRFSRLLFFDFVSQTIKVFNWLTYLWGCVYLFSWVWFNNTTMNRCWIKEFVWVASHLSQQVGDLLMIVVIYLLERSRTIRIFCRHRSRSDRWSNGNTMRTLLTRQ